MSDFKMDPALSEYVAEGHEIIERVAKNLRALEAPPFDAGNLTLLYRDVHTLKGSSQLFGFKLVAQVSHALEASLDPVRKGLMKITPQLVNACSRNVQLLERLLAAIERTGSDSYDEMEIVRQISFLIEATTSADESGFVAIKEGLQIESSPPPVVRASQTEEVELTGALVDSTIRVPIALLDRILNLVGELVLVRNQLNQHRSRHEDPEFLNTTKNLDVVTSDLQGEVMKTRMQPIDAVVSKFQRVVHDMAQDMGKRIDLTVEGADTELDKSLLEAIRDPLTHIVRNACDHGLETIEERKKANKPETGHLLIRSFHEGGQVVIEISDDGRGINRKRVADVALERGLLSAEKIAAASDREICELLFLPGFSTSHQVSAVSGRGVGMDVVKSNTEKIGGSVEIKSVEGKGTSVQLRIPLTLAIVPALIIRTPKAKFAVPQVKLVELVRANGGGEHPTLIENLQGRPMVRLRGNLLPLFDLRDLTGEPFDVTYAGGIFILVLSTEGDTFGLLVPEVLDTADIVVKPLSSLLHSLATFSGATILGDGTIALILDVRGVAEKGQVLNKRLQKIDRESFSKSERARESGDIQDFLLFSIGTNAIHALPLCLVHRLEEFAANDIEASGDQKLVRYREQLLPLIDLRLALGYSPMERAGAPDRIQVIVVQRSGRNYGLMVEDILDVTTVEGAIDDSIRDRVGVLGNMLHRDDVLVVVDALGLIETFNGNLGGNQKNTSGPRDMMGELRSLNKGIKFKAVRVLYAEDVPFFRKHVAHVLAGAGIDVTTVEDGQKALQELEAAESDRYNLVLSDIEMPNMTGLELAREIRRLERFKTLPIVALSTRFRDRDIEEGLTAGFNAYLEKLNPEKLLNAIDQLMKPKSGAPAAEGGVQPS